GFFGRRAHASRRSFVLPEERARGRQIIRRSRPMASWQTMRRSRKGFALYEVLMGLAIFALGVLALGRAAQNCLNASTLNAEENRVRQILSNRMAEVQATPGFPDATKEFNVDTGYGIVKLIQQSEPAEF